MKIKKTKFKIDPGRNKGSVLTQELLITISLHTIARKGLFYVPSRKKGDFQFCPATTQAMRSYHNSKLSFSSTELSFKTAILNIFLFIEEQLLPLLSELACGLLQFASTKLQFLCHSEWTQHCWLNCLPFGTKDW